jgi:hypothetical protein
MANPLPIPLKKRITARYFFFFAVFFAAFFFVAMLLPPSNVSSLESSIRP